MGHRSRYSPRQEEILDSLEQSFMAEGLRGLKLGDLVQRARCSRATVYELAPTKEELFLLVLDRRWQRLGQKAREGLLHAPTSVKGIERYLLDVAPIFQPSPTLLEDIASYGPARRLLEDHIAIAVDFLAGLVASGIREGEFRPLPPRVVAQVLSAAVTQFALFGSKGNGASAGAVTTGIDIVLYGLLAEDVDRKTPRR